MQIYNLKDSFGLKFTFNTDDPKPKRNLIVCIDNKCMNKNVFSLYTTYLPYILYKLSEIIDYKTVYVLTNFPYKKYYVTNDINNVYNYIEHAMRGSNINTQESEELLIKTLGLINENNTETYDVLVLTQNKIYNDLWINEMENIKNIAANLVYVYNTTAITHNTTKYNNLGIHNINVGDGNYDYIHEEQLCTIVGFINNAQPNTINITIGNDKMTAVTKYKTEYFVLPTLDDVHITVNTNPIIPLGMVNTDINTFDLLMFARIAGKKLNYSLHDHKYRWLEQLITKECKFYEKHFMRQNKLLTSQENEIADTLNKFVNKTTINANYNKVLRKIYSNIAAKISQPQPKLMPVPIPIYDINADTLKESRQFFSSMFTLTDWYEEIENNNSIGLLISVHTNDLVKIGANGAKPIIKDITMTFVPVVDYINAAVFCLEQNESCDINNIDVIQGNVIGTGNGIVPLYICEQHWSIAKQQLQYVLSILLVNNPFAFVDAHYNFMFYVLTTMTCMTFESKNLNIKFIRTYFVMYRTCAQIAFEKGYHKGIKKLLANIVNSDAYPTRPFDNETLFGQILSTGCNIDNAKLAHLCRKIFEGSCKKEMLRHTAKVDLFEPDEVKKIEDWMNNNNIVFNTIKTIITNYKMIQMMKELFTVIKFTKFIKMLDDNYGVATESVVASIIKNIKKDIDVLQQYTVANLYETLGITNSDVCITDFIVKSQL